MIRLPDLPRRWILTAWLVVLMGIGGMPAARADELSDVHRLHYAGQTDAALQKADAYLATKPKDAAMRFLKGVMLADTRRNAEAIEVFQRLTEDFPDLAEPYNNLAALYAASADYDKARSALEQALRTNPGYATAHENLGDIYAMLASQSYSRAMKLDPNNSSVPRKLTLVRELFTASTPASPASAAPP